MWKAWAPRGGLRYDAIDFRRLYYNTRGKREYLESIGPTEIDAKVLCRKGVRGFWYDMGTTILAAKKCLVAVLPRPSTGQLHFQREAQEGPDKNDDRQDAHRPESEFHRDRVDDVRRDEEFQAQ